MRIVWADRGPRTLKYHQLLDERLALQPDERALITVLLLRGPRRRGSCAPAPTGCTRSPTARRWRQVLRRLARTAAHPAGARAGTTAGPAGPAVGAPPRAGRARARGGRRSAHRRPRGRAGRGSRRPRREGAGGLRRGGGDVRRAARRRAGPQALRPLAAGPRGASSRTVSPWWTSVRVPATSRRTSPPPGRTPPGVDLSPAMVDEARRRFPHLTFSVGDLNGLLRPPSRGRLGSGHGVVRAGAPRRLRARAHRRLAGAGAGAGWLAGAGPARRCRGAPRGRADGRACRRRLRAARPRRGGRRGTGGRAGRRGVVPPRPARG